jgi:hypothetical protein
MLGGKRAGGRDGSSGNLTVLGRPLPSDISHCKRLRFNGSERSRWCFVGEPARCAPLPRGAYKSCCFIMTSAIKGLSQRALHGNGHRVLIALSEPSVLLSSSCLMKLESSLRDHMSPKALGRGGDRGFSFLQNRGRRSSSRVQYAQCVAQLMSLSLSELGWYRKHPPKVTTPGAPVGVPFKHALLAVLKAANRLGRHPTIAPASPAKRRRWFPSPPAHVVGLNGRESRRVHPVCPVHPIARSGLTC